MKTAGTISLFVAPRQLFWNNAISGCQRILASAGDADHARPLNSSAVAVGGFSVMDNH
jgi:hypothetical protein